MTIVFCDPIALLCDIGGVFCASRCPYAWYFSALLLIELNLLLSYTGDGDGFEETEWFDFNGGCAIAELGAPAAATAANVTGGAIVLFEKCDPIDRRESKKQQEIFKETPWRDKNAQNENKTNRLI